MLGRSPATLGCPVNSSPFCSKTETILLIDNIAETLHLLKPVQALHSFFTIRLFYLQVIDH